jgi:AcrR family transcriptional regulator
MRLMIEAIHNKIPGSISMPKLSVNRKELLNVMMKEAIYDATVSVLHEHGVSGMTMDRVASAAHLAKGSLYNYFHDKKDLLHFVYSKIVDPILWAIAETAGDLLSAPQKLETILRTLFGHLSRHRGVLSLLLNDDPTRAIVESTKQSGRAATLRYFIEIFKQGIADRSFRELDPELAGRMLLGAIGEIFQQQLIGQHQEVNKIIEEIMGIFLYGVSVDSAVTTS